MTGTRTWRIGELAAATGLTVRTLHHYEQLGLLSPARTEGHQRIYAAADVRRLYEIRALCQLGLPLREVGRVLDRGGAGLDTVLRRHRARVEADLRRLEAQRDLLDAAIERADATTLLAVIEATGRVSAHVAGRRPVPGAEARWRALGEALRGCLERGEPPTSPSAQAVAREVREAIAAFADGDTDVIEALGRIRRLEPPAALAGWTPPLFNYLDQALEERC